MLIDKSKAYKRYDYDGACTFYLFSVVVLLVGQAIAAFIIAGLEATIPNAAKDGNVNTAIMIMLQVFGGTYIIVYSLVRRSSFNFSFVGEGIKDERKITPAAVIVPVISAVVLFFTMYLPTVWYSMLTKAMGIPEDAGSFELNGVSSVVMLVIASVFLAPVFEETVYRGTLLHGLKDELGVKKSIALSALAFMLMHMSPMQVVYQFALGVLSALIVLTTRRLVSSVLLHASSNAFALVVQLTPIDGALTGAVAWLSCHAAAAFFITLGLFVLGWAILLLAVDFVFCKGQNTKKLFRIGKKQSAVDAPIQNKSEEKARVCAFCGTELGNGQRFCKDCGASVDALTSCPACGERLAPADRFCKKCGAAIPFINAPDPVREKALAAANRKSGLLKYWIGAGICMIVFVLNLVTLLIT